MPSLPVADFNANDMAVTPRPSSDMFFMENMYYDSSFDSVHFDVTGYTSPRPNNDGVDRDMDQTLPLRFSPRSPTISVGERNITQEDTLSVSRLQRNMDVMSLLNKPPVGPTPGSHFYS